MVYIYSSFSEEYDCAVPGKNIWIPNQSYNYYNPGGDTFQKCTEVFCNNGVLVKNKSKAYLVIKIYELTLL